MFWLFIEFIGIHLQNLTVEKVSEVLGLSIQSRGLRWRDRRGSGG